MYLFIYFELKMYMYFFNYYFQGNINGSMICVCCVLCVGGVLVTAQIVLIRVRRIGIQGQFVGVGQGIRGVRSVGCVGFVQLRFQIWTGMISIDKYWRKVKNYLVLILCQVYVYELRRFQRFVLFQFSGVCMGFYFCGLKFYVQ